MNGKMLELPYDDGTRSFTWLVDFTVDGVVWRTVMFEDLGDARAFARGLMNANAGNERFAAYFERTVVCDTHEFLDGRVEGGMIHVIAPSAR